jgi:hypothetical protein
MRLGIVAAGLLLSAGVVHSLTNCHLYAVWDYIGAWDYESQSGVGVTAIVPDRPPYSVNTYNLTLVLGVYQGGDDPDYTDVCYTKRWFPMEAGVTSGQVAKAGVDFVSVKCGDSTCSHFTVNGSSSVAKLDLSAYTQEQQDFIMTYMKSGANTADDLKACTMPDILAQVTTGETSFTSPFKLENAFYAKMS